MPNFRNSSLEAFKQSKNSNVSNTKNDNKHLRVSLNSGGAAAVVASVKIKREASIGEHSPTSIREKSGQHSFLGSRSANAFYNGFVSEQQETYYFKMVEKAVRLVCGQMVKLLDKEDNSKNIQ